MRKTWLNIVLGAFLAGAVTLATVSVGTPKAAKAAPTTAAVQRGSVQQTVSATGNLAPLTDLAVNFNVSGKVTDIQVSVGQHVTPGQVLAHLDPTSAHVALGGALAQLSSAQAKLQQDLAGATAQQKSQDAVSLAQAQAQVAVAQQTLADDLPSVAQDATNGQTALTQAQAQQATDQQQLQTDQQQLQTDQAALTTDTAAVANDVSAVTADQATVADDQAAVQATQQQQATDQSNLSSAQAAQQQDCASSGGGMSTTTTSGPSAQCQADRNAVASDQTAVTNDNKSLLADNYQLSKDQAKLSNDNAQLSTDKGNMNADKSAVTGDQSKISSDQAKITGDANTVTNARNNQATTAVKDKQSLDNAQNQLANAQLAEQATATGNAVKEAPALPGTLASDQAGVAQAQATVDTDQQNLDQTTLTAPATGTVAAINGTVGQFATSSTSNSSSSSTSSTATASTAGFVHLSNVDSMQLKAPFVESDAAQVKPGQPATVTVQALPSVELAAHVIAIDVLQTVVSNVVNYNVTFALDRTAAGIRPGMTANVTLVIASHDNVLHLPSAAIRGSGANATVTVLTSAGQVTTPVVVGIRGDTATEILSGVSEGQRVVVTTAAGTSTGASNNLSRLIGGGGLGGITGGGGGGGRGGG
jgi:multidrug efflux pump subunit AcrA (membrane-fusion protein)